jgi:hypothetical protein
LWQVPWRIPAAAAVISSTVWKQLACTYIAISWILSLVLTVLGRSVCSSSSELSLPCARRLWHKHSTVAQDFFTVCLLDHLKHFDSGFAYFLTDLDVFPLLKLWHSRFLPLTDNYPSQQRLSFRIHLTHAHSCFMLGREKSRHSTISWLHVSTVVHNSTTMWPVHEFIDSTTY